MDAAERLAVVRARGVARAIGVAVCLGGLLAVCGWLLDTAPLAAFAASPVAPMRMGSALALATVGGALVAAAYGRPQVRDLLVVAALVLGLLVVLDGVAGLRVSPYELARRVGVEAPSLERAAPEPPVVATVMIALLGLALFAEGRSARVASWLSAVAGAAALAALVDRVGGLDRPATAVQPALATTLLCIVAAGGVQALLGGRAGAVYALWGEASLRARLLRGFVLPLPFVLTAPVLVALFALDDPDEVRVVARWAIATVPTVTAVSALLGARVVRRSVNALRGLSDATGRIAEGRYDEAVPARPADEIGQLADSFDSMQESLRQRSALETILRDAVHAVTIPPDLEGAFEALGDVVARHVPNDRAGFSMYENGELRVLAVHGPSAWRLPVGSRVDVAGDLYRNATDHGETVVVRDTAVPGGGVMLERLRDQGFGSFVSVPVLLRGETRAFVSIASLEPDGFTETQVSLFQAIVREAGGPLVTLALLDTERETAARLRELDALKTEFVGVVAHDLRSPMTVISGYVDLVLSRWDDIPDEQKRELLQAASRGTKRLSVLVEDILTVARIESGSFPIEPRPFDLQGLIARTVGDFAVSHPDREVDAIVPTDLPRAFGDEDRNWQILTNLVSNALKFSPVGTPVVVSAGTDGDMLAVHVRDNGVGVAPEDLPRLFQKFSRIGRPVSEKTTGNGLGLYICRALVEAQGGSIAMSSTPGEGSCVTYTIPTARESS